MSRPTGSRNFKTIVDSHENQLAEAYVEHALQGSATLLQDVRRVKLPIDSDAPASASLLTIDRLTIIKELQLRGLVLPLPPP